jgi:selenocysteine lyase/cysteine desulfurase
VLAPDEYERGRVAGYLDSATYGLPPSSTLAALERATIGWRDWEDWHRWEGDGEACRELFARVVGGESQDVALVPAVSVAAGIVAASLPIEPGDNVVCYEHEFHSALFPWLGLETKGVEVRLRPLDRLADAVDDRTAIVAVSSVQSADGQVADLAALKATGARLFVDGTQSVGALPIDLDGIDYLAVAAYKWLLCPRGLGFLVVSRSRLAEIEPWLAGWKSRPDPYAGYYGPPRELTPDARRLDVSLPWLVAAGARPSLELLASLGAGRIAEHDLALARRFCTGCELPDPVSPIVQVPVDDTDAAVARLRRAGVKCAPRAGSLRFSFHLYNEEADVDLALSAMAGDRVFASESLSST